MSLEQAILEAVRTLPVEKQNEVLELAQRLSESTSTQPRRSGKGLWAHLNISLSAEDIDENQRDMWKNFPREDI